MNERESSEKAIADFVEHYEEKFLLYKALAEKVQEICQDKLDPDSQGNIDVRALVTCRAKTVKSLREKLLKINQARLDASKPLLEDTKEIQSTVVDLAGVRIALYVPSQKEKVIRGVETWFKDVEVISKRGSEVTAGGGIYSPVFAGYTADHARVKLFPTQGQKIPGWKQDQIIEIQVVSVLLHAWAEVEHDITYKNIQAEASYGERTLLDSINGSLRAMEILLDQLHTLNTDRNKPFSNKFALAMFLDEYIGGVLSEEKKNNLELKMPFTLLKAFNLNSQHQLSKILVDLGFKETDKLSNLKHLGPRYTELTEARKPFPLALNMHIPYYIMHGIVSTRTDDQVKEAEHNARGDSGEVMYRCRVILSSWLWIGHLARGGTDKVLGQMSLDEKALHSRPFDAPARYDIIVYRAQPSERDRKEIELLWQWFEEQLQDKDSFFGFVFKLSKMGVMGSFPEDIALLQTQVRLEGSQPGEGQG